MGTQLKLYVGNLDKTVQEQDLRDLFGQIVVEEIKIVRDTRTQQSKGFCLLTVANDHVGQELISLFSGFTYRNKKLIVTYLKETEVTATKTFTAQQTVQTTAKTSPRKVAKRNFKRNKDDDFNGPWR